jgi:hypothetical protein
MFAARQAVTPGQSGLVLLDAQDDVEMIRLGLID